MALNYDPKRVKFIFGGVLIQGFADGSFISIEHNADLFSLAVGADGEGVRSKSNNRSARITLRLNRGSSSNVALQAALTLDRNTLAGSLPLAITDLSNGTVHAAEGAWVVRDPNHDYQAEAQAIEWVLETDRLEQLTGASLSRTTT